MKNGLTLSIIFEAESANYGESLGNITSLKQISRSNGEVYTYISRQALRYNIIQQLNWDNTPVEATGSGDKAVIQFEPKTSILDYPEIDLFGYMKTEKNKNAKTRSAVVRLSNAISLEPFNADMDFLTNMGLASRTTTNNSIAQSEIHKSLYAYTVTIDLDRVGKDIVNENVELESEEKIRRVTLFLKTIEFLYRDIRGRRENLSPIFAIGGIYDTKCPFFENRLKLSHHVLDIDLIQAAMEPIKDETLVGYMNGSLPNDSDIKERLQPLTILDFFQNLCKKVEEEYHESN